MASQLAATVANEEELRDTLCAMFQPRVDQATISQVGMLPADASSSPRTHCGGLAC
jgi:hypothetical protein